MTQATAAREAARRLAHLRQLGTPSTFTGGPMWSLPKRQFQALYVACGSFGEALAEQPALCPWPRQSDGEHFPPEQCPQEFRLLAWARAVDAGEEDVDPKLLKVMEDKIDRKFRADARRTILESGKAVQELARKARTGELGEKTQVQLLYASQAHNYGLGNYGAFVKATQPVVQQNYSPTFNLNTGTKPPSKRLPRPSRKRLKGPVIEAQFSEVPVGSSDT